MNILLTKFDFEPLKLLFAVLVVVLEAVCNKILVNNMIELWLVDIYVYSLMFLIFLKCSCYVVIMKKYILNLRDVDALLYNGDSSGSTDYSLGSASCARCSL